MEEKSTYRNGKKPHPDLGDVPPGYFEGLEERIMSRILAEESDRNVIPMPTRRTAWWRPMAAAACAAGIVLTAAFGFQQRQPELFANAGDAAFELQLDQISSEELESALIEDDVTVEEITASMDEESLNSLAMEDILSPEEVESLFSGTIASAEEDHVILGLESSVITDWEIDHSDIDVDDLDLSAFGLDADDLKAAEDNLSTTTQPDSLD
jgi:hypothetical protein